VTTLTLSSETILVEEADELIAKTSPDQLVVNGIVGDGTVVSFQLRGGMNRGTAFLFEIHGDQPEATAYPFSYSEDELPDLLPFMTRRYPDPEMPWSVGYGASFARAVPMKPARC
jgi:hypothetical protein